MNRCRLTRVGVLVFAIGVLALAGTRAAAHCDTMDGPVVVEARVALDRGDVTTILKWITADDEAQIREAFEQTLAVRGLNDQARALADTWFFETLVRVHRASEGEPYTGLKPAGTPIAPAVVAADEALESGSVDELAAHVAERAAQGIKERFAAAHAAKAHKDHNVTAGRAYVAAYVSFVHYVERLAEMAEQSGGHGHAAAHAAPETPEQPAQTGHAH